MSHFVATTIHRALTHNIASRCLFCRDVAYEALTDRDALPLLADPKTTAPRPPQHSSVPSLLTSLQNEYDAIILETFTLKKHYDNLRQELAHALYSNDASARVIARLLTERDQAREALANIQGTIGAGPSASAPVQPSESTPFQASESTPVPPSASTPVEDVEMDAEANGALPKRLERSICVEIDLSAESAPKVRKARSKAKVPEGYASPATVAKFAETKSLSSLHNVKPAGVTRLSLSGSGKILATGGNDTKVQVYDRTEEKVIATLRGHSGRITAVALPGVQDAPYGPEAPTELPEYVVSASEDHTVKLWSPGTPAGVKLQAFSLAYTIDTHEAEVTGLDVHALQDIVGSASRDGVWALHNLSAEALLVIEAPTDASAEEAAGGYVYESFVFHPDGQFALTGTAGGAIRIWDLKTGHNISTLRTNLPGKVSALGFSENGYFLAAGSNEGNTVEVYDLRKLVLVGTITTKDSSKTGVQAVRFDPSLQFLAVATDCVNVYANKTWEHVTTIEGSKDVTDLQWDRVNGDIVVSSSDRTVRTYGIAA